MYVVDKDNNNVQVFAPGRTPGPVNVSSDKDDEEAEQATQTQEQVPNDPNSPTRHGKSYFREIFESDPEDPVYVLSHSTTRTKVFGDTTYEIVGEIKNNSDEEATFVKITATFYNDDGIVIGTDFTYTDPHDIRPGRTAPYSETIGIGDSIDVSDIAEAKYSLKWD